MDKLSTNLEIIRRYMSTYPVDVYAIAHALGITVQKVTMPATHSASIHRQSNGKYLIKVNIADPETRQRFSVAHEIGHYLYHRSLIGDGVADSPAFRSPDPSVYETTPLERHHETQANRFAANLLMPRALVQEAERQIGRLDIPALARMLNVSVPAMRVRKGMPPYPEAQEEFEYADVEEE